LKLACESGDNDDDDDDFLVLVVMATTRHDDHHQPVRYVIFAVTMILATNDVTVGSASNHNLTLVLMTPLDGNLGFERNAAASTLALQQAQADGLLSGMRIKYVEISMHVCHVLNVLLQ